MKYLILTITFFSLYLNGFSATRVFYEDYETTSYSEHFLENQFGTDDLGWWNEFKAKAHQSTTSYAGTYSLQWTPVVDLTIRGSIGFGAANYGNLSDFDFGPIEARYWYIRWYQRWPSATYTGKNKIIYIGCGGDYYYVAKGSDGEMSHFVIRDEFGGNNIAGADISSDDLDDGAWHKIVLYIDFGSSNSASDGDTYFEIDDQRIYTVENLNFVTLPAPIECISHPGNVGLAETPSGSQDVYIDELEVYTLTGPTDIPGDTTTTMTGSVTGACINCQ